MYKIAVYNTGVDGYAYAVTSTSKTAKMIKRWYYSTAHWQLVDVTMGRRNITFFIIFLLFSIC